MRFFVWFVGAFFLTHVGCVAPPVWQNERVLQGLKRMLNAGVKVKLITGLTGHDGHSLPSEKWPEEFEAKLKDLGIARILRKRGRELPNHSIVAGSARQRIAYICPGEEDNIYPTTYFRVRDKKACEEWKDYLVKEWEKHPASEMKSSAGDKPRSHPR